jgi:predicted nucleic acid-binding protein
VIVVDTNVIAYCWTNGPLTATAQALRVADPDWHAPVLWQSELRNVLIGLLRAGALSADEIRSIMAAAEHGMRRGEHCLASGRVLEVAERSRLSAYDCEYVALADALGTALVTADRAILRAFPDRACSMERFLEQYSH